MEIFAHNMEPKIGAVKALGLKATGPRLDPKQGPRVLLFHGCPDDIQGGIKDAFLRDFDWVLCISSGECGPPLIRQEGRLRGLSWGMDDLHELNLQPNWKQDRFRRFVNEVLHSDVEPPWDILVAPMPPEHIIACYLCSLADTSPEGEWKMGFDEEVSYWTKERKGAPELNWENDRSDRHKLRQFLVEIGEAEKAEQSKVSNAAE